MMSCWSLAKAVDFEFNCASGISAGYLSVPFIGYVPRKIQAHFESVCKHFSGNQNGETYQDVVSNVLETNKDLLNLFTSAKQKDQATVIKTIYTRIKINWNSQIHFYLLFTEKTALFSEVFYISNSRFNSSAGSQFFDFGEIIRQ